MWWIIHKLNRVVQNVPGSLPTPTNGFYYYQIRIKNVDCLICHQDSHVKRRKINISSLKSISFFSTAENWLQQLTEYGIELHPSKSEIKHPLNVPGKVPVLKNQNISFN